MIQMTLSAMAASAQRLAQTADDEILLRVAQCCKHRQTECVRIVALRYRILSRSEPKRAVMRLGVHGNVMYVHPDACSAQHVENAAPVQRRPGRVDLNDIEMKSRLRIGMLERKNQRQRLQRLVIDAGDRAPTRAVFPETNALAHA